MKIIFRILLYLLIQILMRFDNIIMENKIIIINIFFYQLFFFFLVGFFDGNLVFLGLDCFMLVCFDFVFDWLVVIFLFCFSIF